LEVGRCWWIFYIPPSSCPIFEDWYYPMFWACKTPMNRCWTLPGLMSTPQKTNPWDPKQTRLEDYFLIGHVHCLVNIVLPGRKQRSQAQEWIQYMACDRFYFYDYTFFNLTTCFDNKGHTVLKYKKVKWLTS
jgi:hypothetical protein